VLPTVHPFLYSLQKSYLFLKRTKNAVCSTVIDYQQEAVFNNPKTIKELINNFLILKNKVHIKQNNSICVLVFRIVQSYITLASLLWVQCSTVLIMIFFFFQICKSNPHELAFFTCSFLQFTLRVNVKIGLRRIR
jgi:hypothetical protein